MSFRVVVDARELSGRPTGVGRYLRELLVRWADAPYAAGAECLLIGPADPPAGLQSLLDARPPGARLAWRTAPGSGGTAWEQGSLAGAVNQSAADVVFCPAYTAPLRARPPIVVAIHDVSFAAHPEWFGLREGIRRRVLARWSARKAAAVVTLTRFSAGEIVTRLGVRGARIHVIPLAVDYRQTDLPDGSPARAADQDDEGAAMRRRPTRVLFVGSIFERRHLPLLVEGVARAVAEVPALTLDVIGDDRSRPPVDLVALAASLGVGGAVRVQGYVNDATLAEAYRHSGLFAFLSAYEGFGLPPLEAMRAGLATLVLDTPVAREVYGDGVAYVPAGDAAALARTLVRLATDTAARAALVERGGVVAGSYRWDETAERTWRVLERAAGRHP